MITFITNTRKQTTPLFATSSTIQLTRTHFINTHSLSYRRKQFHSIQSPKKSICHISHYSIKASAIAGKEPPNVTNIISKSDSSTKSSNLQAVQEILQGVYQLSLPLFNGKKRVTALFWIISVVCMAFSATLYAVLFSATQRTFWNVLNAKDASKFGNIMLRYVGLIIAGPIVTSLFSWAKERLALLWRRTLTESLLGKYFNNMSYYKLNLSSNAIDNPDQRISEDVSKFTDRAVRFFCIIGVGIFDLISFSVVLYRVYSPLFYLLIGYTALGTLIIVLSGRRLLLLNRQQVQREANFRYGLVRVRESTESVAFYAGERAEEKILSNRFESAFRNKIHLLSLKRNVDFASSSWRYYAQIVPSLVIAPRYFAGKVLLGTISQVYFSFNHVLSSLGLVITEFSNLAEFGAGIRRLNGLSEELNKYSQKNSTASIVSGYQPIQEPPRLKLRNLTLYTPSDPPRLVIKGLNLELETGKKLLVVGRSGIGKSSLMRAICGLWNVGEGQITKPSKTKTLFLSQRPFIMLGSLRENVIYPSKRNDISSEEVEQALVRVNLGYVVQNMGGLDASGEILSRRLSLGEQQRLAFARILISKPEMVVLDESSSALDLPNERDMYKIIEDLGITCISVGNRPSLAGFHDSVLRIESGGEWSFESPEELRKKVETDSH